MNKYLVSTPIVKNKLMEHGVPDSRIEVTGIPVHPDFWTSFDKDEIRRQFDLNAMPTVLIMGGGWGLVNDDNGLFEYMAGFRDSVQLIFCAGNNDKVKEQLKRAIRSSATRTSRFSALSARSTS